MAEPIVITAGGAANKKRRHKRRKKNLSKKNDFQPEEAGGEVEGEGQDTELLIPLGSTPMTPSSSSVSKQAQNQSQSDGRNDEDILEAKDGAGTKDKVLSSPPTQQAPAEAPMQEEGTVDPKKPNTQIKSMDQFYNNKSSAQEVSLEDSPMVRNLWLLVCFLGIMFSFVCYGLLLEYATSGGRKLHELSFLFVTSGLYTLTAAAGRYVRDETPTSIPPARFAVLGLTSMGSTFCSVRSLRYVIYPIQVLAKSCKPVPVMVMGAFMGKKYPVRKYINVCLIVLGVALFMGGGGGSNKKSSTDAGESFGQSLGVLLLFVSLCFDGGTGAYEDKLMAVHSVGPFDLMYNIQLGKTILAGIGLLVLNQVHVFMQMCQDMGFLLVALGLSGAMGQVFIFVTIAKFGALTCSIIGLARKVTTLVASIVFYGHPLSAIQFTGLVIAVSAMVMNFWGKKSGGHGHHTSPKKPPSGVDREEMTKMLQDPHEDDDEEGEGDVEMQQQQR